MQTNVVRRLVVGALVALSLAVGAVTALPAATVSASWSWGVTQAGTSSR